MIQDFTNQTKSLIDELKKVCADFGLGNDGNESKIITQTFQYKFMNDKLGYELKQIDARFATDKPWESVLQEINDEEFRKLSKRLPVNTARLNRNQTLSYLFQQQGKGGFASLFDKTLVDISNQNSDIFSISTASRAKITLFDPLSQFIADPSERDNFAKALVNKLVNFSFESIFDQKFDFFSTIFEYLIKDYNKDGGGKYAEYYTPHAVSKIMAKILVDKPVKNVTAYDPSAGSGTLLMNVAHEIGEKNCSIYSQDISQKSSGMLRLNLILNDLVHSIPNVIQGNTLLVPAHKYKNALKKFDFIVSNPPFKLDFSDFRDDLDSPENRNRFFAGIPSIPKSAKETMAIYLLFLQHIISSLSDTGKAAIVVPSGFLTIQDKIAFNIRKKLVDEKMLRGVISMPSNIFATTGTKVSILFVDKSAVQNKAIFLECSDLGETVKEGKNKKTLLSSVEEDLIISSFLDNQEVDKMSVLVSQETIVKKDYSFNPGHYLPNTVSIQHISLEEFRDFQERSIHELEALHKEDKELQTKIVQALRAVEKSD
jgi:type I restriction enzyme M protein